MNSNRSIKHLNGDAGIANFITDDKTILPVPDYLLLKSNSEHKNAGNQ